MCEVPVSVLITVPITACQSIRGTRDLINRLKGKCHHYKTSIESKQMRYLMPMVRNRVKANAPLFTKTDFQWNSFKWPEKKNCFHSGWESQFAFCRVKKCIFSQDLTHILSQTSDLFSQKNHMSQRIFVNSDLPSLAAYNNIYSAFGQMGCFTVIVGSHQGSSYGDGKWLQL